VRPERPEPQRLANILENTMRHYIALIHKDADSDYGVSFPDLPGVISAGSTLDEARDMAAEALALHLEGLAEDGEAVPEPSSLEEIMANPQNRDGVAVLIPVPAEEVKTVRVNITLPADVLSEIDRYAEQQGFTRSGFLTQAAKKAMAA
jgi:predicted RNase H-like HicB family nuclease